MAICYHCFKEYPDNQQVCPHCGYTNTAANGNLYYLPAGTKIGGGRYLVGNSVNAGGFGIVYRILDTTFQRVLAVKEYFPSAIATRIPGTVEVKVHSEKNIADFESGKKRFLSEARKVAKFQNNPNIVDVYDYFEENQTAYMVMEYMDGMTYKQYIKSRGGKVNLQTAYKVTIAVLDALSEVHKERIIHRDINPNNIFICKDGKVKLYDFGAARLEMLDMTAILTPCYAPPEQYTTNGKQGSFTDLYAVGATMYFAITGIKPQESTDRLQDDGLVPPHTLNPEIPLGISNAIMRSMALKEQIRFQSADEFKKALADGKVLGVQEEINRRRRKRAIQVAAMFIVLAAAGGTTLFGIQSRRNADQLKPVDLNVWLISDENDTAERITAETRFMEMTEEFQNEYGVPCAVTVYNPDQYVEKLNSAAEKGELPDVFDSTYLDPVYREKLEPLDETLRLIEDRSLYYFLERYEELFPDKKQMPLCFQIPLIYVRFDAETDAKTTISGLEDLKDQKGKYSFGIRKEDLAVYEEIFGESCLAAYERIRGSQPDYKEFVNGKTKYYLSDTSDYQMLSELIPGQFQIAVSQTASLPGRFDHLWSVNGASDKNKKKAAQWLISYMLRDRAQSELTVKSMEGIPLNKLIYEQVFKETYQGNFQNLDEEIDGLEMKTP